jgi:hypothetical protein
MNTIVYSGMHFFMNFYLNNRYVIKLKYLWITHFFIRLTLCTYSFNICHIWTTYYCSSQFCYSLQTQKYILV